MTCRSGTVVTTRYRADQLDSILHFHDQCGEIRARLDFHVDAKVGARSHLHIDLRRCGRSLRAAIDRWRRPAFTLIAGIGHRKWNSLSVVQAPRIPNWHRQAIGKIRDLISGIARRRSRLWPKKEDDALLGRAWHRRQRTSTPIECGTRHWMVR